MAEDEYKTIFSKNLRYYMNLRNKNQMDLMRDLNLSSSTVSNWCTGLKLPRMDKVQLLADYLGIRKSDLIEEKQLPTHTSKDERDIKRDLDRIMGEIRKGDNGPLYYNGVEISDASVNLLQNAIEFALKETKIENKEKYNPNKNKK